MRNSYPHSNNIDFAFWTVDVDEKGSPFLPNGENGESILHLETGFSRTTTVVSKNDMEISEIEWKKRYQKFLYDITTMNGGLNPT